MNVIRVIDALVRFQQYIGKPGLSGTSVLDPDSLPLGLMRLGGVHNSSLHQKQAEFVYALWSITGSVFVLGGDLTSISQFSYLQSLYTNHHMAMMHLNALHPKTVAYNLTTVIWTALDRDELACGLYVGIFGFAHDPSTQGSLDYYLTYDLLNISTAVSAANLYDVINQVPGGTWHSGDPLHVAVSYNHAVVYRISLCQEDELIV